MKKKKKRKASKGLPEGFRIGSRGCASKPEKKLKKKKLHPIQLQHLPVGGKFERAIKNILKAEWQE